MSLAAQLALVVGGSLAIAAALTLGFRRLFPGRERLLSSDGGSPALRAITATYGLLLAFVLGATLQSYLSARQQSVNEASTVVSLDNLAHLLPPPFNDDIRTSLACYATTVVNKEFPALKSGKTDGLDNHTLVGLYTEISSPALSNDNDVATVENMTQQLSNLTSQRDARIRAAKSSLPELLWVLVIGGGVIVLFAVAAITYVDRPWPQFFVLAGVAAIILAAIFLIRALEQPYRSSGLRIDEGDMRAALTIVSRGLERPYC
jgi:hypothetical protein